MPCDLSAGETFVGLLSSFGPSVIRYFGVVARVSPSVVITTQREGVPMIVSRGSCGRVYPGCGLCGTNGTYSGYGSNYCVRYLLAGYTRNSLTFDTTDAVRTCIRG